MTKERLIQVKNIWENMERFKKQVEELAKEIGEENNQHCKMIQNGLDDMISCLKNFIGLDDLK
jgi:hypothetical protein